MATKPSVSVIVCSYNGAKRLGACLKSLHAQYVAAAEIIVVDDGSTDRTAAVAGKHGVTVTRHPHNLGRAAARNTGLHTAKSTLVAYLDDDCIADPAWLQNLTAPFIDKKVVAVGGKIIAAQKRTLAQRFMEAMGYGNSAPASFAKSKNPVSRFVAYLGSMFRPIGEQTQPVEASAVFTANVAYRRKDLQAIHGFDTRLASDEDADVSNRLRPRGTLLFVPNALVKHNHFEKLGTFVSQTFTRSENTYRFYRKMGKSLPLYPFPLLYVLVCCAASAVHPLAGLASILFAPPVVYGWWIVRAWRQRNLEYIAYAYAQLALETASVAGLVRGAWRRAQRPRRIKVRAGKALLLILLALTVTSMATLAQGPLAFVATPFVLVGMVGVPGLLLALALNLKPASKTDFICYAAGLGLAFWLIGGLALNWLLPLIGIAEPLRPGPLWIFFVSASALLSTVVWWRHKAATWAFSYKPLSLTEALACLIPVAIMLCMTIGAAALNNGGTGIFSLVGIGAIAASVLGLVISQGRLRSGVIAWALWAIGAALLLMYALRSGHVLGWDIHSELHVFNLALEHGFWSMDYFPGEAYNACLSITILPAIFANFLPIPPEYIFKFIMQLLFAAVPAIVFLIARRYMFTTGAALAGFIFLSQSWFYEQMPALIRQEIALLFFTLALLAVLDASLKRWQQVTLFLAASVALILSHYSTAYVWLALFGLALGAGMVVHLVRPKLRSRAKHLTWPLFIVSVACIFVWEGVITQTGGSFTEFANKASTHASEALSPSVIKDGVSQLLFAAPADNAATNLQKLLSTTNAAYVGMPNLYDATLYADFTPTPVTYEATWTSTLPGPLSDLVLQVSKISKLLIINVFTVIGIGVLLWRLRRSQSLPHYMFTALCVATLPLIIAILFLPIFQVNYNITRLFTQAFIVLSLATIVGMLSCLFFMPKLRVTIAGTMLVVFFLFSVGFTERFIGGPARLTLQQPQGAFDTYYVYDTEVASARWLKTHRPADSPLYADMLAGLRLRSYAHAKTTSNDIFPSTIAQDAYVYTSHANQTRATAYAQFGSDILTYTYPLAFLEANKDTVYSSGTSKVYK